MLFMLLYLASKLSIVCAIATSCTTTEVIRTGLAGGALGAAAPSNEGKRQRHKERLG